MHYLKRGGIGVQRAYTDFAQQQSWGRTFRRGVIQRHAECPSDSLLLRRQPTSDAPDLWTALGKGEGGSASFALPKCAID